MAEEREIEKFARKLPSVPVTKGPDVLGTPGRVDLLGETGMGSAWRKRGASPLEGVSMNRTGKQLAYELRKRINDAGPGMKVRETMLWVIECADELSPGLIDEVAADAGADKHRMRDALKLAPFVRLSPRA